MTKWQKSDHSTRRLTTGAGNIFPCNNISPLTSQWYPTLHEAMHSKQAPMLRLQAMGVGHSARICRPSIPIPRCSSWVRRDCWSRPFGRHGSGRSSPPDGRSYQMFFITSYRILSDNYFSKLWLMKELELLGQLQPTNVQPNHMS